MANKVYLAVPYKEKDLAKSLGAKWDPNKKKWFAPNGEQCLLDKWSPYGNPITELKGENLLYNGESTGMRSYDVKIIDENEDESDEIEDNKFLYNARLYVDLIPKSSWFRAISKYMHSCDWDRIRKYTLGRAKNQCECCGGTRNLGTHARYSYNGNVQKLERFIVLCSQCNKSTHMGLSNIKGIREHATNHLIKVTKMNKFEADNHITQAFLKWESRNHIEWQLDLSLLTNNNIKIIYQ